MVGLRAIPKMGWVLIVLALLAAAGFGLWRYALNTNSVALLDWADRQFGGNAGYKIALADGRYGPLEAHKVEVIVPDQPAAAPRPVLVFIHGGGWHSGTPGDYRFVGRRFAREGYVVVTIGYRLGPDGVYPHMLDDSAQALLWVQEHAASFTGDPNRVFVMGHSAGAYNAMMLALERQWLGRTGLPDDFIKGVIGLSGPYDFFPFTSDSTRNAFGHESDPAITQPIHHARSDAPPILLLTGDADTTVRPRNSIALAKALTAKGLPTEPGILAGVDHSGTIMKLAEPFVRDRRVLDPVLAFLAKHGATSGDIQAKGR
jgi:acetyl esterase/lipase